MTIISLESIKAFDKSHLQRLIQYAVACNGLDCDLNHIDVSDITDMSGSFRETQFNGDVSRWNVGRVTQMQHMFSGAIFCGYLGCWEPKNETAWSDAFVGSKFMMEPLQWGWSENKMRIAFGEAWWEMQKDILKRCGGSEGLDRKRSVL
jgi:hypothetical protein